jgi:hypothetical protein
MKSSTRRAKLLDLWDDDEEVQDAIKQKLPKSELEQLDYEVASFEAHAALIYVGSYEQFFQSECVGCEKPFASSYARVTTCSDRCLKKAIEDLGFVWDPSRHPVSRWRPENSAHVMPLDRRKGESLKDFESRQADQQIHLANQHPVPLTVDSAVVEMLDKEGIVPLANVPQKPSAGIPQANS